MVLHGYPGESQVATHPSSWPYHIPPLKGGEEEEREDRRKMARVGWGTNLAQRDVCGVLAKR